MYGLGGIKQIKKEVYRMKKMKVFLLTIVMVFTLSAGSVYAENSKVSGSASVGVFSNYVWRGQKLSNSYVIQPSVGISYRGFGFNIWSNIDSDYDNTFEHTETDFTVDYAFDIDRLSLDVGYIYYGLEGAQDTQEVYISAGYDILLNPTLTFYYDFDEGEGGFIVASIGHSFELPGKMELSLGASASYNMNNEVMGYDDSGDEFSNFYNGEVSASLSIPVADMISLEPVIAYTFPLSNDAKDALNGISDDGDDDLLYGGLTLTLSF